MYLLYPWTFDHDQLRLEFETIEDRATFERVCELLHSRVACNEVRETPINDFQFDTTLQAEIAQMWMDEVMSVVGLETLNVFSKKGVGFVPLPMPKQE